jgi:hypothetical protein
MLFLIDQALLNHLEPIPGGTLGLDLNAEPPAEEQYSSCAASPKSFLSASSETLLLFRDHAEPSTLSSTGDDIPRSLSLPLSTKRKFVSQLEHVEEQTNNFLDKESYLTTSKKQVRVACKIGNSFTGILESNQFPLREARKASIGKGKDLLDYKHQDIQRLELLHEEGPSQFFSVLNWKYVILEPEIEMSNQKVYASLKIHNQHQLFESMNKFTLIERPWENFSGEECQEWHFFHNYHFQGNTLLYPN